MGVRGARESLPTSTDALRELYERLQGEVGPNVTIVVATKYVAIDDMAALSDAGVTVVGENRAQDLEAKHARYGTAFRWHFIGHLQKNKVRQALPMSIDRQTILQNVIYGLGSICSGPFAAHPSSRRGTADAQCRGGRSAP